VAVVSLAIGIGANTGYLQRDRRAAKAAIRSFARSWTTDLKDR
jgi:hypothetical protein